MPCSVLILCNVLPVLIPCSVLPVLMPCSVLPMLMPFNVLSVLRCSVLEGGYNPAAIANCTVAHVSGLARLETPSLPPIPPKPLK